MTAVRQALASASRDLAEAGLVSPQAVATTLVAHVVGLPPGRLLLSPDLTTAQSRALAEAVAAVAAGQPPQYVTGQAWFRTVCLAVGPGVFIPRPETELLAGWAIDQIGDGADRVVELCAGSGAIAAAIVAEAAPAAVWAVEADPTALVYLRRNLASGPVHVVDADMAVALPDLDGGVDLVVANPPYIATGQRTQLAPDVLAQPTRALFAGPDGLAAMPVVAATAWRLVRPGGLVGCEHGDGQAEAVEAIFTAAGWVDVRSQPDLTGRPRFVTARRPVVG